jgi:hypothetical protein
MKAARLGDFSPGCRKRTFPEWSESCNQLLQMSYPDTPNAVVPHRRPPRWLLSMLRRPYPPQLTTHRGVMARRLESTRSWLMIDDAASHNAIRVRTFTLCGVEHHNLAISAWR